MTLQVIGAGYGRTGTESLRAALELTGFGPCHHMHAIRDDPALLPDWQAFADGTHRDWDRLFRGFRSQVDFPGAAYWKELASYFPEAKVILTIRDPDDWFESVKDSVLELMEQRDQVTDPHHNAVLALSEQIVGNGYFEGRGGDRAYAISRFKQHTENVRAAIAPERLLVFDVREGWAPFCEFLGIPVPEDQPFPHSNDMSAYHEDWNTPGR